MILYDISAKYGGHIKISDCAKTITLDFDWSCDPKSKWWKKAEKKEYLADIKKSLYKLNVLKKALTEVEAQIKAAIKINEKELSQV